MKIKYHLCNLHREENLTTHINPKAPVIVGVGQFTQRKNDSDKTLYSPAELISKSASIALQSSGLPANSIDTVAAVRLAYDTNAIDLNRSLSYPNLPYTVSQYCGLNHASQFIYNDGGGNSPLKLIGEIGDKIAAGEVVSALVVGGEALHNQRQVIMQKKMASTTVFADQVDSKQPEPTLTAHSGQSVNKAEYDHGLSLPINAYPLIANGLRGHYGQTSAEHIQQCAELGENFSGVAKQNPYSWFPRQVSATEIATVTDNNRWIGFPYPKLLNSIIMVNMSASVVVTSWENAQQHNIAADKCVFLHGSANVNEIWNLTERENFHSSRAIRENVNAALAQSGTNGITTDDLDFIDLYSCFPCAVQIGADELGLSHHDPRGLTVTGGLPYFGGPGNNYAMHSVAEIYRLATGKPGSYGLATGNGWYLTKHSSLVLSTTPSVGQWHTIDTASLQKTINSYAHPTTDTPTGMGSVEAYTVCHGKDGIKNTIIIGKQLSDNKRFVALAGLDGSPINQQIQDNEFLNCKGLLRQVEWNNKSINLFEPQFGS